MAWCFEEESTQFSEAVLEALSSGAEAVVPAIWAYEVVNVLLGATRRKRIPAGKASGFLDGTARTFQQVKAAAEAHNLTAYDAAYVELARRENLPLATLDRRLRKATQGAAVRIFSG